MNVTAAVTKLVKHTLLAAPLALAPAVASVMMQAIAQDGFQSGVVYAAEAKAEAPKPKYKTRKTPALREKVFKKLAVVQELTSPEEVVPKIKCTAGVTPSTLNVMSRTCFRVPRTPEAITTSCFSAPSVTRIRPYFRLLYCPS